MPMVDMQEQLPVARLVGDFGVGILFTLSDAPLYICELVHDEQTSLDLVQTFINAAPYRPVAGRNNVRILAVQHCPSKVLRHWRHIVWMCDSLK
jgi:hypothetical protein